MTVRKYFSESLKGYSFKKKKKVFTVPYIKGTNIDTSRDADMCERYKKGETLKVIGESYGVCRERVRQIIDRYGLNGSDGGKTIIAKQKVCANYRDKDELANERIIKKYGCTLDQWRWLRAIEKDYKKSARIYLISLSPTESSHHSHESSSASPS